MKHLFGRDILKGEQLPFDIAQAALMKTNFFTYSAPAKIVHSETGRRMNHFCLGADPEFMFISPGAGPVHATTMGLKPGLAFGADQNDRLVELRAAPSRDAIKVLGSVLAELRWLYRHVGEYAKAYEWHAHAFAHGDGMGGHVHFGRKRPHQDDEVRGLDGLAKVMRDVHLFDSAGWTRRAQGDQFHQLYGQYGDIRAQKHGYEYRTLPTWLDNPRLAFLVLTLSKLVVLDPDITASWNTHRTAENWSLLQGLAKYYKGRDDDALLLYSMMSKPEPFRFVGGDFRLRWGLTGTTKTLEKDRVIPSVIEGTDLDINDLRSAFTDGKALVMRETEPNFKDSVPTGYQWIPAIMEYRRRPNIGDIFYDMVQHKNGQFAWDFDTRGCQIFVPPSFKMEKLASLSNGIEVRRSNSTMFVVKIGTEWRKGPQLAHLRTVLYSGHLPLWKVEKVESDSFKQWESAYRIAASRPKSKYVGVIRGL